MLVANALKVALGAHWPTLNAHEFTPKDVYQLAIYDTSASPRFTLQNCPDGLILDASGRGSYCQLLGPYVLPLNDYNSVPVAAHMNEHCAAQWPAQGQGVVGGGGSEKGRLLITCSGDTGAHYVHCMLCTATTESVECWVLESSIYVYTWLI